MATLNWLDAMLVGYRQVQDESNNVYAARPTIRFTGNTSITDNALLNTTDVAINADIANATSLATPDTLVKRDAGGGTAFAGSLTANAFVAASANISGGVMCNTITVTGVSTLSTTRVDSLDVRNGGVSKLLITTDGLSNTLEGSLLTTVRTANSNSNGVPSRNMTVETGATTGLLCDTGTMTVRTGAVSGTGSSGSMQISTGGASGASQTSGFITFLTGAGPNTGNLNLQISTATSGNSGSFNVDIGGASGIGGGINMSVASGGASTGNFVVSVGSSAGIKGNFAFTNAGAVPNYVGGRGVFYVAPAQTAPGVDAALVGMLVWCDAAGHVYFRTKLGTYQPL